MKQTFLVLILAINVALGLFADDAESFTFNHNVLVGPTQGDLNFQAKSEFDRADEKLNEYYNLIFELYAENPVFLEKLLTAQRLWIQFRNAHLESIFPEIVRGQNIYGSVYPMCYYIKLSQITWERVIFLESFITPRIQGDVCNGVRGIFNAKDYDF